MAGTEESTLVLGEPNIKVKVCVSLKRLLIVTFNIKATGIYIYKQLYRTFRTVVLKIENFSYLMTPT